MASTNRKLLQETPSISKYFKPVSITDHRMNNRIEELKDKLEKLREKQQEEAKSYCWWQGFGNWDFERENELS